MVSDVFVRLHTNLYPIRLYHLTGIGAKIAANRALIEKLIKNGVAKSLLIYTCLLIVVDLFFNIIINLVQGNPGEMIMISIVVRIVCLAVLFSSVGLIVLNLLKQQSLLAALGVTTIIVYLLVPIMIYFLKENEKGLWQVYIDLHIKSELFAAICLPYLLASCVSLPVVGRSKLLSIPPTPEPKKK